MAAQNARCLFRSEAYRPAIVPPEQAISNPYPTMRPVPCAVDEGPPHARNLNLEGISEDTWAELDAKVRVSLQARLGRGSVLRQEANVGRVFPQAGKYT